MISYPNIVMFGPNKMFYAMKVSNYSEARVK